VNVATSTKRPRGGRGFVGGPFAPIAAVKLDLTSTRP
jgi:hypothetical protein